MAPRRAVARRPGGPDGEVCGDTGSDGIQTVLEARGRRDAVTSFLTFDILAVDDREAMREPWEDRRKRLDDIGAAFDSKRIAVDSSSS